MMSTETVSVLTIAAVSLLLATPTLCHGAKAEVRQLNGAPALFINGEPSTGLMFWTCSPVGGTEIADGRLEMSTFAAGESVATRENFGDRFAVEVTLTMRHPVREDASAGIKVQMSDNPQSCYYFGLGYYSGGNRIKFWKVQKGSYLRWFTPPWAWEPGKAYRLRLEVEGSRIAGYVDGKLVAEKTDESPLAPAPLLLLAHHCEATFDDLRVTALGAEEREETVLLEESFDRPDPARWEPFKPSAAQRLREFAQAGVHLFTFIVDLGWKGPDRYDYAQLDAIMREVVRADPQALVMPRVYVNGPGWWLQQHPDEECQYIGAGKKKRGGRQSFSSALWQREAGEALRQFIQHIQASDYADHIFAYHVEAGPMEWFWDWGSLEGEYLRDYAPAHEQAFRAWLGQRYDGDLGRLRTAWADPEVDFATAQAPSVAQRTTGTFFEFFDPAQGRQVPDYLGFHSEVVAEALLHFAHLVKEQTNREQLFVAFYGYYFFGNECPGGYFDSGHQALAQVLASPDVDGLCAPHNYQERQPGGCCLCQLISSSVRLHGKLFWDEDDTRTALAPAGAGYGRCKTVAESIEVLRRNFAYAMSQGGTLWWMEHTPGWFSDPQIGSALGQFQQMAAQLLGRDRSTAAEIAVIVNERSGHYLRRSPSLVDPLVADQMLEQVVRIGAPFDTYLASDLADMPEYKLYIFLNALYLTPGQRQQIQQRICTAGHAVLWVYAPGFVTEEGLSVEAISELIGMRLRMYPAAVRTRLALSDLSHELTRGLPPGLRFGPHDPIGPVFFCDDPQATILGQLTGQRGMAHYEIDGGPGLAVKDLGAWRSVWCGVPNLPAPLLRNIARWAGVHIYSDRDDVVYATPSLLAVHARHAGERRVLLPELRQVVDAFSGEVVAENAKEFRVELGCAQTGLWLLNAS